MTPFEKMQKLSILPAAWKNINVKVLNCKSFRNMSQHFVTSGRLKSNKPPMLKLRIVKLAFSIRHFCISDVNKIQTKIAVILKVPFSESYYKMKATVEVLSFLTHLP